MYKFFTQINKNDAFCIATLFMIVFLSCVPTQVLAERKKDRAALKPLLLLDDGKRYLKRKNDPFPLLKLIDETKSEWTISQAKQELSGYYALTGNWSHYRQFEEFATPCAKLLYAIYEVQDNLRELVETTQIESPNDRVCFAALNALTSTGHLRDDDVWRKIRSLVNSSKSKTARVLLKLLKDEKVSSGTLNKSIQNATVRIKGKHALNTRVSQELLAVSAIVAARRNPILAGQRWDKFEQYIDKDINDNVWPILGTWASLDHNANEALDYFRRAPLASHDRLALAWRARAAMRVQDWQEVQKTIEAMQGEQATFSAWHYWHARALWEQNQQQAALKAWTKMTENFDDYYGLLAASHLNKQIQYNQYRPNNQLVEQMAKNLDVRLAIELGLSNRTNQARDVWKFLQQTLPANQMLAAAQAANVAGWYLGSVNAADAIALEQNNHNLRFPLPLEDQVLPLTERFNLNPSFVYALIRRESRFNTNAKSSAGARGLMQVMPATGHAIAKKYKYTRFSTNRLYIPGPNLLIGTRYLADLINQLGDDPVLVAASYNAGPRRVRKWLKASKGVNRLVFIETIPFTETRLYVKAILGAMKHYDLVLNQPQVSLDQLLAGKYG